MTKTKLSVEELDQKVRALGITLSTNGNQVIIKKAEITKLVDSGLTRTELAEIYGLSMANINKVLKQLNLTTARQQAKFLIVDDDYTTTPDAAEEANIDESKLGPAEIDRLDNATASYVENKGVSML